TLRALAVTTAARSELLPTIPTIGEFVQGYQASLWFGLGAPRATPKDVVEKLNKEINAGLSDPTMRARLADLGGGVLASSPAEFGKLIEDEIEKWDGVSKLQASSLNDLINAKKQHGRHRHRSEPQQGPHL